MSSSRKRAAIKKAHSQVESLQYQTALTKALNVELARICDQMDQNDKRYRVLRKFLTTKDIAIIMARAGTESDDDADYVDAALDAVLVQQPVEANDE